MSVVRGLIQGSLNTEISFIVQQYLLIEERRVISAQGQDLFLNDQYKVVVLKMIK